MGKRGPEYRLSKDLWQLLKPYHDRHDLFATLLQPVIPGLPDWLILTPNGTFLIELKAGSPIRKAQKIVHQHLSDINQQIVVLTRIPDGIMLELTGTNITTNQTIYLPDLVETLHYLGII